MSEAQVPQHNLTAPQLQALRELDARNAELRDRNAKRLADFKEMMGTRWVLHPDNAPKKVAYRPVLS